MAKLAFKKDSTNVTIYIFIQDSNSTTGEGLTNLKFNTSGLTCYYLRPLEPARALSLQNQTITGEHVEGGFVEVSSSKMPGIYRLDLSDAMMASFLNPSVENPSLTVSSPDMVILMLRGATDMAPCLVEIQLTDLDLNDISNIDLDMPIDEWVRGMTNFITRPDLMQERMSELMQSEFMRERYKKGIDSAMRTALSNAERKSLLNENFQDKLSHYMMVYSMG